MYLNFFQGIKDIIDSLFNKRDVSPITMLLFGIIIGFLIAVTLYVIIVTGVFKKGSKKTLKKEIEVSDEDIIKLVKNAKNKYNLESSMLPTVEKFRDVGEISKSLVQDIASIYYPESRHPVFELSINEIFELMHYITNRVDSMLDHKLLRNLKNAKITQILYMIDLKKKIDENKAVKAAKKVAPIAKWALTIVKAPINLVKKIISTATINAASNKLAMTVIDIVGEETVKVYSKHVFNEDKNINLEIEKSIYELENMLDTEEK